MRIVPATVGAIAEPRFRKTVLSPVAAPRRCLDTENVSRFISETLRKVNEA